MQIGVMPYVKVKYVDEYVEWVLLRRLGLLEVEERAGMARVAGQGCVEERVTRVRNGELEELKGRFVGQKINKWFKNSKGIGQRFVGEVNEVWMYDGTSMGRVEYDDGDFEDLRIDEIEQLIQQGNAPPGFSMYDKKGTPTYEDQWPVFEVSEEDLLFFSKYHEASVQAARDELNIIDDKAAIDVSVLESSKCLDQDGTSTLFCGSVELCYVSNFDSKFQPISQTNVSYQGVPSFIGEQDDMAEKSVPVQVFEKKSLPLIREQPNKCLGLHSSFQQAYARVRTGNLLPHDIWVFAKALVFSVVVPTFLTNKTNRVAGFRTIVLLALIMCEFAGWDPPRHAV